MKSLNKYGVCTDPEVINIYYKDCLRCIQIEIAETPQGWAVGGVISTSKSGILDPCTASGRLTREEAIQSELDFFLGTEIARENPAYYKAIQEYKAKLSQFSLF